MVSVRSAILVGFYLVNKNKILLIIPLIWELSKALLLLAGLSLGSIWPPESRFFVRFAIPASWPSFDQILPSPVLSPDFAPLLTGRLAGKEGWFLVAVLVYAFLDSLARGWFLVALRDAFAGQKVQLKTAFGKSIIYLNQFFILRLLTLVGYLLITAIAMRFPYLPQGFWDMVMALGAIGVTFVDLVIVYGDTPMPSAIFRGISFLGKVGTPIVSFLIWGSVINAALSVPLNWAVSYFPAFIIANSLFIYAGVILSAGLMYLFTTSLLTQREG